MEFKSKQGAAPVIKLYSAGATKPDEVVSVENWDEETLNQFIEEKLEAAAQA